MIEQITFKKLIGGFLIGGLLLGSGAAVLADTDDSAASSQANAKPPIHGPKMPGMQRPNPEIMQSIIDGLIADGTLTQAQSDEIIAKITQLEKDRKSAMDKTKAMTPGERAACRQDKKIVKNVKIDLLTKLVNDGTITSEQAVSIKSAIQNKMVTLRQAQLQNNLAGLVDKGTLTSEQSAAILAKIAENDTARKAEMEKIKAMTQAERQAYRQENKTTRTNPLDALVSAGTLTQAQADEVLKVLGGRNGQKGPSDNGRMFFKRGCHQGPGGK